MRDLGRLDALRGMVGELIRLGLRHPSCPTYAVMAAVSLVGEVGADQSLTLSRDQQLQRVNITKSVFRNLVQDVPDPAVYGVALPQEVSKLVAASIREALPSNTLGTLSF